MTQYLISSPSCGQTRRLPAAKPALPSGGDAVVVLSSTDPQIPPGVVGVVEGMRTGNCQYTRVVFYSEPPYRDDVHCKAQNGIARVLPTKRLLLSPRHRQSKFWRWRYHPEQVTETYEDSVSVWALCLTNGRRSDGLNVNLHN